MLDFLKSRKDGDKGKNFKAILLIVAAAIGVGLLLLGGSGEEKSTVPETSIYDPGNDEVLIYQKHLEKEIKALCESVRGVDHVTVAVSLSGSFESFYATETENGNDRYVIVGSGSSASPLPIGRLTPEICGIGVVCTKGNDAAVKNELIRLLCATYSVNSNRIYITEAG